MSQKIQSLNFSQPEVDRLPRVYHDRPSSTRPVCVRLISGFLPIMMPSAARSFLAASCSLLSLVTLTLLPGLTLGGRPDLDLGALASILNANADRGCAGVFVDAPTSSNDSGPRVQILKESLKGPSITLGTGWQQGLQTLVQAINRITSCSLIVTNNNGAEDTSSLLLPPLAGRGKLLVLGSPDLFSPEVPGQDPAPGLVLQGSSPGHALPLLHLACEDGTVILVDEFRARGRWDRGFFARHENLYRACNGGHNPFRGRDLNFSVWVGVPPRAYHDFRTGRLAGHEVEFARLLAGHLGAELRFKQAWTLGVVVNGSINGLLGDLLSGGSRAISASWGYTGGVERFVRFSLPLFRDKGVAVARRPRELPPTGNTTYPFQRSVWAYSLASFLAVTAAAVLFTWTEGSLSLAESFSRQALVPYGLFFREFRFKNLLRHVSWQGRAILVVWVAASTLLSRAYEANLKTSLTVVTVDHLPESNLELLASGEVIYIPRNNLWFQSLKESDSYLDQLMYRHAIEKDSLYDIYGPEDFNRIREKVAAEGGSFYNVLSVADFNRDIRIKTRQPNPYAFITGGMDASYLNVMAAHSFPHMDVINSVVGKLDSAGIPRHLENKQFLYRGIPDAEDVVRDKKLEPAHLYTAMAVGAAGSAAAAASLLGEFALRGPRREAGVLRLRWLAGWAAAARGAAAGALQRFLEQELETTGGLLPPSTRGGKAWH